MPFSASFVGFYFLFFGLFLVAPETDRQIDLNDTRIFLFHWFRFSSGTHATYCVGIIKVRNILNQWDQMMMEIILLDLNKMITGTHKKIRVFLLLCHYWIDKLTTLLNEMEWNGIVIMEVLSCPHFLSNRLQFPIIAHQIAKSIFDAMWKFCSCKISFQCSEVKNDDSTWKLSFACGKNAHLMITSLIKILYNWMLNKWTHHSSLSNQHSPT